MLRKTSIRVLSVLLTVIMLIGMLPVTLLAGSVSDYDSFLKNLKTLEDYASAYSQLSGKDKNLLMINFIRTGVERYQDDNWTTLAGAEITAFTTYVEKMDGENSTTAMDLRDIVIDDFKLPNGNQVDFGHMFGTMNIAYLSSTTTPSADLGGWAGDICDLLLYSKFFGNVPAGSMDQMAEYILDKCFGVNADDAFGMDDFYGDMDAYYLVRELQNGAVSLTALMEAYFTEDLSNADRAAYFLNHRFSYLETKEDVRNAVYDAYRANAGLKVLEAKRELAEEDELRQASCYAFADYLFSLAGDRLEGGVGDDGATGGGNEGDGEEEKPSNGFYSVFSSTSSVLAPGISQTIRYATTADKKQMVYYVATIDVTRDDVTIKANYKDNDPSKGWGFQRVEDQVKAMVDKYIATNENFRPIVAINGDGYNMSTGEPGGLLVMDGKEWKGVDKDGFFAILKDGTAVIGTQADYATYKDQIKDAIGGFGAVLIKDGEIVTDNNSGRASRTAIGITAEGKVVMMVLDGRQEPFSCGGTMREIAQILFEAGCVEAVNLDGGGSTTYLSKPEGSDSLKLTNRPSDGYARSVATSLVAISTAKSSNEFDHANITSDYDYLTINTSLKLTAMGVSNIGSSAPLPTDAAWQVSDSAIGSITADGTFTALQNGEVEVQLVAGGEVIGSKTLYVVVPDALTCTEAVMRVVYDTPTTLPLLATYNGNPVAVNPGDFYMVLQYSNAGYYKDFDFVVYEASGYRTLMTGAMLLANQSLIATVTLNVYRADEAYFDFNNATAGDSQLAWDRFVSNAETSDDVLFQIIDTNKNFTIDYTFALDMTSIEIPDKLQELTYMLPGADAVDATAWNFLLQLAERVSTLTEVTITAQFDKNLQVDISNLQVFNDFFTLKSATLDDNNKLTIVCGWLDQTQAIDPSIANPICILTGIKMLPKSDAKWNSADQLVITNVGDVSYNIYLRASALYSFANIAANQQQYNLYPFVNPNDPSEKGASFGTTYKNFSDSIILDKTNRQGWHTYDDQLYYFVNNKPVVGIQKLPSHENASVQLYYTFDEKGVCQGAVTGLFEQNGKYYYAFLGEQKMGWQSVLESNGQSYFYYFSPYRNGAAIESGRVGIEGYYYTFENYHCVLGSLVTTSTGRVRYTFAGSWQRNQWVVMDGKKYYLASDYYCVQNAVSRVRNFEATANEYHLFDENGVWLEDVSGLRFVNGSLYLFENGKMISRNLGLTKIDGDYYYFRSSGAAVVDASYWITNTGGELPQGSYYFDENGKMEIPTAPEEGEKLNGVVELNGKYYYYVDGKITGNLGVKQFADEAGETYYIYVRTDGSLATGRYWITKHNDLLPMQAYDFGADGKYYPSKESETPDTPVVPDVKNGIVEENGEYYYYEDGKLSYLGLVKLTDESGETFYIYVRSNGKLATGRYWPTKHNDVLPLTGYDFGTNGRYYPDAVVEPQPPVQPDEKNGIVEVDGVLYYYENGKPAYKGLMKFVDEEGKTYYIYSRTGGKLATGKYWPTKTNDLLPYAGYDFGTDGKYYPEA